MGCTSISRNFPKELHSCLKSLYTPMRGHISPKMQQEESRTDHSLVSISPVGRSPSWFPLTLPGTSYPQHSSLRDVRGSWESLLTAGKSNDRNTDQQGGSCDRKGKEGSQTQISPVEPEATQAKPEASARAMSIQVTRLLSLAQLK